MGLYNTIVGSPDQHPVLSDSGGIQFKWGHCWLHNYRVGDAIEWAGERPSVANNVLEISGIGGGPDVFRHFVITVDNDVITGFREVSEDDADQLEKCEPRTLDRIS